jgi:hypothetical protein
MMHEQEQPKHVIPYTLIYYIISKPFDLFTKHQVLEN